MKNTQPLWNTASHTSSAHAHLLARGRGVATPGSRPDIVYRAE